MQVGPRDLWGRGQSNGRLDGAPAMDDAPAHARYPEPVARIGEAGTDTVGRAAADPSRVEDALGSLVVGKI